MPGDDDKYGVFLDVEHLKMSLTDLMRRREERYQQFIRESEERTAKFIASLNANSIGKFEAQMSSIETQVKAEINASKEACFKLLSPVMKLDDHASCTNEVPPSENGQKHPGAEDPIEEQIQKQIVNDPQPAEQHELRNPNKTHAKLKTNYGRISVSRANFQRDNNDTLFLEVRHMTKRDELRKLLTERVAQNFIHKFESPLRPFVVFVKKKCNNTRCVIKKWKLNRPRFERTLQVMQGFSTTNSQNEFWRTQVLEGSCKREDSYLFPTCLESRPEVAKIWPRPRKKKVKNFVRWWGYSGILLCYASQTDQVNKLGNLRSTLERKIECERAFNMRGSKHSTTPVLAYPGHETYLIAMTNMDPPGSAWI